MRVVHIITRMIIGGAQENTLFNCLDLLSYGDEVILLTGPTDGPEGRLLEQGRAGGLRVETIASLCRSIHPMRDYTAYRRLMQRIHELQPDVVHTHSAKGGMLGRAAAWANRVPVIVHTVHGAPFHPYQSWITRQFYRACEKWAAKRCHHLIAVADAMRDLMIDHGIVTAEKISTIYSGMDVEPFLVADQHRDDMRRRLGYTDERVVVGKIARLFELKGHEYIIEAAREVVRANPTVRFLLVGDGSLRPSIEESIAKSGLKPFFTLTGLVAPEEIPQYLSAMDIVVHCSLREGLARTLPQALLAGKPVVSFDIDGAREVCIDNQTGFLIPPKDIHRLGKAIVRLTNDAKLRAEQGRGGQQKLKDQFRHQTMTAKIRELYERLLAKSGYY
jgi:glycosyltransferase involved in cell wall biosynthesis